MLSVLNLSLDLLVVVLKVFLSAHDLGHHPARLLLDPHGYALQKVVGRPLPDALIRNLGKHLARGGKVLCEVLYAVVRADEVRDDAGRVKVGVAEAAVVEGLVARTNDLDDKLGADDWGVAEGVEEALYGRLRGGCRCRVLPRGSWLQRICKKKN
jgi:hypothetical protein